MSRFRCPRPQTVSRLRLRMSMRVCIRLYFSSTWKNGARIRIAINRIALLQGGLFHPAVILEAANPHESGLGVHQIECYTSTVPFKVITSEPSCDLWNGLLWAVPKKRTSHSKKRMRMTHKYLKPIHHYSLCPKCGNLKMFHMLCGHCFKEIMKKTAELRRLKQEKKNNI